MTPLHVCYLCNEYPPAPHGGVGTLTRTLARGMVERGHRATVVGVYPAGIAGREEDRGVQVIRLAHTSVKGAGLVLNGRRISRELRRVHREMPIDVLEGPELSLALVPAAFPATKVIRMSGGHHFFSALLGTPRRRRTANIERRSFRRADGLAAVSRFVAEETRSLLGIPEDRSIEILPNPVDTEGAFRPRPEPAEEDGLLLFWGTLCEKKGIRQLLQAMPAILAVAPHARLWVAGREGVDRPSGRPFMEVLRPLIDPGWTDRVRFLGPIAHERLPDLIARASVCVLPSHMEAFGIAWVEAMAMARPVVASRTGPGPEVVEDNVTGRLCDPHDPDSIAAAAAPLLKDAPARARLGAAARKEAEKSFSIATLAAHNEAFYRSRAAAGDV